jgi:Transglutaminase-like superfamily
MTAPRLTAPMAAHLWARSAVLPDLTRAAPLKRVLAWYTPGRASAAWEGLSAAEILAYIDRHLAGCRRMRGRRCLRRGLLAFYFLRLAGHAPVLHLGVFAQAQGRTLAHCWTTVGAILDDPPQAACVEVLQWRGEGRVVN